MSRGNLSWLLGVFAVTLVGLSLSYSAPRFTGDLEQKHKNLNLLVDVMAEVENKYVRPLDDKQMRTFVENMINGGLQQLDPHSNFISEEDFRQFQRMSQGHFGGIGIRITAEPKSGAILVESPMVGTPAYEAGILAGDIITKIDGTSTENMMLNDVVKRIQGKPGDPVLLTVVHEGSAEEDDIKVTRAEIHVDSVLGDLPLPQADKKWDYMIDKENKVAYVRITAFTETTVDELTKVVQELQKEGMQGLVIDLRNNPGGLLESAVKVSSMFLPPGERVVSTKGREGEQQVFDARPPRGFQPILNVPIAILLNRYSASASEIVAAALKDHLRAVIVGERSYGKGSVQNIIRLENGKTAVKLTTASYWRPSGKNIHRFPDSKPEDEWGVKPNRDCEVKLTVKERLDYYKYRRDRDILSSKKKQAEKEKSDEDNNAEGAKQPQGEKKAAGEQPAEYHDRVLEKALEYIHGKLQQPADVRAPQRPTGLQQARSRQPATINAALAAWAHIAALYRRPVAWA